LTIESILPAVTPKYRFGRPSDAEGIGGFPVRLRDDADAETLRFQQAPDQRHAEAGMVDIGIAGDQDDIATVPAQRVHFLLRHRQEGETPKRLAQ
jgi:hypothetical protein